MVPRYVRVPSYRAYARRRGEAHRFDRWLALKAIACTEFAAPAEAMIVLQRTFCTSEKTAYRWVRVQPDDAPYLRLEQTSDGPRIRIAGWDEVQEHLEAPTPVRIDIPVDKWQGPQARRAAAYANELAGRQRHHERTKPVARETLRRATGFAPATQRKYEARLGVHKQSNYAQHPTPAPPHPWWWRRTDEFVLERIANSYSIDVHVVGRRTTRSLNSGAREAPGATSSVRRYFYDVKQFLRSRAPERAFYDRVTGHWAGLGVPVA